MYYVLTESRVIQGKNLGAIKKELSGDIEENEFKVIGPDKVIKMTERDIEFVQDKKKLSNVAISKLFRKKNELLPFLIVLLLLNIIILIQGCTSSMVLGG